MLEKPPPAQRRPHPGRDRPAAVAGGEPVDVRLQPARPRRGAHRGGDRVLAGQAGRPVHVDQVIAEVETAKAIVEVPVPFAGTVTELHGEQGATLAVGTPLITVDETSKTEGFSEPGVVTADEGSGNVLIGYGTSPPAPAAAGAAAPVRSVAETTAQRSPQWTNRGGLPAGAQDGQGRGHRTARGHRLRPRRPDPALPTSNEPSPPTLSQPNRRRPRSTPADRGTRATIRRIPLRGLRKTVADKLTRSRREIPEATVWVDVDATALLDIRAHPQRDQHRTQDQPARAARQVRRARPAPLPRAQRPHRRRRDPARRRRAPRASPPRPTAASSSRWCPTRTP